MQMLANLLEKINRDGKQCNINNHVDERIQFDIAKYRKSAHHATPITSRASEWIRHWHNDAEKCLMRISAKRWIDRANR